MSASPSTPPKDTPTYTPTTHPRLIIHGGAGHITRANLPPAAYTRYRRSLLSTLRSTSDLLTHDGSTALDAATHAVARLEDNPLFNCGRGAVFTRAGTIELEASIMVSRGSRKRGVGVSLLRQVKNPIRLAREMLVRGEADGGGGGGAQGHCQLSGEVVEGLAREWGCEMVEEGYFWTRRRWEEHKRGLEGELEAGGTKGVEGWEEKVRGEGAEGWVDDWEEDGGWDGKEYLPQGTVGCVCLDQYGTLCVATSTGGLTNKLPGRIGDTPTLGAGFWAEEWEVPRTVMYHGPEFMPPIAALLPASIRQILGDCLPALASFTPLPPPPSYPKTPPAPAPPLPRTTVSSPTRAAALSGTGNGDSFLRLSAVHTAIAIARFAPGRSLASAVSQIAGPGGELQQSAGDGWNRTGEGEGGMVGIEVVEGVGKVVADFNCGGMFRAWVDGGGGERVGVFREEY